MIYYNKNKGKAIKAQVGNEGMYETKRDNTNVKPVRRLFNTNFGKTKDQIAAEIEADRVAAIAEEKAARDRDIAIAAERKATRAKSDANPLNTGFGILYPSNHTRKNWAQAGEGLRSQFRVSDKPNFFDDYVNPANMFGEMGAALGSAPLRAKQSDSVMPYVTAVLAPIATGALAGIGVKSTRGFLNNVVNPLAGTGDIAKKIVRYPTRILKKKGVTSDPISEGFKSFGKEFMQEAPTSEFIKADLARKLKESTSLIDPNFKSQIDWGKFNKEIPNNKTLMKEYNAIEQFSKADGSWMKNFDGTDFGGSPEFFIQQKSKNFRKVYPDGYYETYRGAHSQNRELIDPTTGYKAVFSANKDLAENYPGLYYKNAKVKKPFTVNSIDNSPPLSQTDEVEGLYEFIGKKSKNSAETTGQSEAWDSLGFVNNADEITLGYLQNQVDYFKSKVKRNKLLGYGDDVSKKAVSNLNKFEKELETHIANMNNPILIKMKKDLVNDIGQTGVKTVDVAKYVEDNNLDYVKIKNINDNGIGDVLINHHKPGNYLKSKWGNNGMFDMTNPDIYKAMLPTMLGVGAAAKYNSNSSNSRSDQKLHKGELLYK